MSLKQQALSGIKWTSLSSICVSLIQFLQLLILARFLQPSDFGLMAIVGIFIGFSNLFLDLGISAYIIHKKNITTIQLSSLYWLNIISGVILYIVIFNIAPFIASFYKEIELENIIRLLAINLIVASIGAQFNILFQKELNFNLLAKINITSIGIGALVAVVLAIIGFGVYSLVYSSMAVVLCNTVMNFSIGIKEYRPRCIIDFFEIKVMLKFGLFQIGERSVNYFNSQFDIMLIGKIFGSELLGVYSVAKNLSMYPANLINPIITKVTFPIMASVQNDNIRLKNIYLKTINYLSSINFPIYLLLALLAEPIILFIFGSKWSESIEVFKILLIYASIRSTGNPIGSLQLAKGRADMGFYWNLMIFAFMPISIYFGSWWGLLGVSYSLVLLIFFLLTIPNWLLMVKPLCGASFSEYFKQILIPLIITIAGGGIGYIVSYLSNIESMVYSGIITSFVMMFVVVFLNYKYNRIFLSTLLSLIKFNK